MNEEENQTEKRYNKPGRTPMLNIVFTNKEQTSYAYAYLLQASLTEKENCDRIDLKFGFCELRIEGIKLGEIFRDISLHHADVLHVYTKEEVSKERGGITKVYDPSAGL